MADTTITALTEATGIDGATDWLAIDRTSLGATQKINRNTYLGLTGSPVGTSDSQVLTNKTIGNTNIITLKDTLFTLQDDGDTTKQAKFQLSGITTATTRTYTLPDASSTLADIATAQTLTNKTLTSPVITGGSITGSTITTDAIVGQSAATSGTVYGLSVSSSKISGASITNATIPTAAIADAAVTPAKLITGTGSTWVWQTWTPTWTNLIVTGSTVTCKYIQIGKSVFIRGVVVLGGGNAPTGAITMTLPVVSVSYAGTAGQSPIGNARYLDTGTAAYSGHLVWNSTTTAGMEVFGAAGTYVNNSGLSATIPHAWANTDEISFDGVYEAA